MKRLTATLATLATIALGALGAASPASAATVWKLDLHHNPTNFPRGGVGEYWVDLANVGSTPSSGPITLSVKLQNGLTRDSFRKISGGEAEWSCAGAKGDPSFTCTTSAAIARHHIEKGLALSVDVSPTAAENRVVSAKVQGGGAALPSETTEPTHISEEPAGFGILPESFLPGFFEADETTPLNEAGSHPALFITPFDFNSVNDPKPKALRRKTPNG